MKYTLYNLFQVENGTAKMPFSPGELAKGISKHMGASLCGLVRINFTGISERMFQVKDGVGFTAFNTLIVLLQYKNGIHAIFSLDEGARVQMIAALFLNENKEEDYQRVYDGNRENFQFTDEEMKILLNKAIEISKTTK